MKLFIIVIAMSIVCTASVNAQIQPSDIETHEIKIVKDYNVFIEDASKINLPLQYKPQFQDNNSQKKLTYSLPDRIEQFKFEPTAISPMPYRSKSAFFQNKNYIKIGAGSLLNPLVEWSHQHLNTKNPLKINLTHHSAWLGNDTFQKFSNSDFILDYTHSLKQWKLQPIISVENKLYNFYGNLQESAFKDNSSRLYTTGKVDLNLFQEKFEPKSLSIYNTITARFGTESLNWYSTNQNNTELYLRAATKGTYRYNDHTQFHLQLGAEHYKLDFTHSTDKLNLNLCPTMTYHNQTLRIHGGINFVHAQVSTDNDNYVLPILHSSVQVVPGIFNLYTTWERNIELNSLHSALKANPFVAYSNTTIPNSLVENRIAGIKGSFMDFQYNGFFHQKIIKDALLFANDPTNSRYLISTIEKNMSINNLSLELSYLKMNRWDFYLKGDILLYELDNLPVAYNLPGQKLDVGIHFQSHPQWMIRSNIFLLGGVQSIINNAEISSGLQADINLGGEYQFNKKFYIFAQANNILNSKILQTIGYPSYGINGQLGFRVLY